MQKNFCLSTYHILAPGGMRQNLIPPGVNDDQIGLRAAAKGGEKVHFTILLHTL
jgi:hypothetical protein